jgi:hypothetical protein
MVNPVTVRADVAVKKASFRRKGLSAPTQGSMSSKVEMKTIKASPEASLIGVGMR